MPSSAACDHHHGGSACPAALIRAFHERGVEMVQLWGMTEISPIGTISRPGGAGRCGFRGATAAARTDADAPGEVATIRPRGGVERLTIHDAALLAALRQGGVARRTGAGWRARVWIGIAAALIAPPFSPQS